MALVHPPAKQVVPLKQIVQPVWQSDPHVEDIFVRTNPKLHDVHALIEDKPDDE